MACNIVRKYGLAATLDQLNAKPPKQHDNVFTDAVLFNKDVLDYLIFNDVIKTDDITTMQNILPHLLFRFVGGRNSNYCVEVLELLQGHH